MIILANFAGNWMYKDSRSTMVRAYLPSIQEEKEDDVPNLAHLDPKWRKFSSVFNKNLNWKLTFSSFLLNTPGISAYSPDLFVYPGR